MIFDQSLSRLRRRLYDFNRTPLPQGTRVLVKNGDSPVRLYTPSGIFLTDSGETVLTADSCVDVYVKSHQTYTLTALDEGGRVIAKTFDLQPDDLYDDDVLDLVPDYIAVSSSRNLSSSDDDHFLVCSSSVTLTIPESLTLKRNIVIFPPIGGQVTISAPPTVSLNGVLGATLVYLQEDNVAGIGISYTGTPNTWGVSGDTGVSPVPDANSTTKGLIRLAGDLGGSAMNPSVAKIGGVSVPVSAPSTGQFLQALSPTTSGWTDGLSSGTVPGLIGLVDQQIFGTGRKIVDDIVIGRGNPSLAARSGNTIIGFQSNNSTTIGDNITAVGRAAMGSSTVSIAGSSAFGNAAGRVNTQPNCTFVGSWSGEMNTGQNASHFGQSAGQRNTANGTTFLGLAAGADNTGLNALGVGVAALQKNTGTSSIGVGEGAGYNNSGSSSVFLGYQTKRFGTSGNQQTFVGHQVGLSNTATDYVAIGAYSGRWQTTNSNYTVAVGGFTCNFLEGQGNSVFGHNAGSARNSPIATNVTITQVTPGVFTISPALASVPTTRIYAVVTGATATPITSLGVGGECVFDFTTTTDCTSIATRFDAVNNGKTAILSLYVPVTVSNVTLLGANSMPSSSNQVVLGDSFVNSVKIGNDLMLDATNLLSSTGGERVAVRVVNGKKTIVADSNGYVSKSSDYTILPTDAELRFSCTTALVVTVNTTSKDTIWFPPSVGNLTVRAGSGVTLNGASADQVRSLALNRAGIAIIANPVVSGDFTVTGY